MMRENDFKLDGRPYETKQMPRGEDESIYVSWGYRKHRFPSRRIEVVTRADVYAGDRPATGWYSNCNAVRYRLLDAKTLETKEGCSTFVANKGQPNGGPLIAKTANGIAYHSQPITEHTYATHEFLKSNASEQGNESSSRERSTKGSK